MFELSFPLPRSPIIHSAVSKKKKSPGGAIINIKVWDVYVTQNLTLKCFCTIDQTLTLAQLLA